MAFRDLTDRSAVLAAIAESDQLGEPSFLAKYGFEPSRRYRIEHEGRDYVSKAVLAAAHGVQFPDQGPLTPSEFSGGRETIAKARSLGFATVERMARDDELGIALARFMDLFREARGSAFGHAHPAVEAIKVCAERIEATLPEPLRGAVVKPSVGQGNWAAVPWIAVLHPDVTNTTQHGVYPVLLFREDMTGVEVTIAQGVTELMQRLGRRAAVTELTRRSVVLRTDLHRLADSEFLLDDKFELGRSTLARNYAASTVVHRLFARDGLATSTVTEDVAELLASYGDLMVSGKLRQPPANASSKPVANALMVYVGRSADANFESGGRRGWWGWKQALNGLETLRPGDLIAFGRGFDGGSPRVDFRVWQGHKLREVIVGRITHTPERTDERVMPDELTGDASYPWKMRFEIVGTVRDVSLAPSAALGEAGSEALRLSAINRGVAHMVPVAGSRLLEAFLESEAPLEVTAAGLAAAAQSFAAAVYEAGVRLSATDVTAFLAAVATKPFAILTGQSGSGKTQLAMRLGDWFGSDRSGRPRCLVVPVRPDWTGPEYLFGYPDALRSSPGKEIWSVPDALEFVLSAREEPDEPYLLVLDEMNLAHVERYFADFLSGIESRQPILPELQRIEDGWVAVGNSQRLPLPRNLIVVGTVNVDETTYLFSPKVLDRAFTFEFRTATADLDPALRRPTAAAPGDGAHRRALSRVLRDDDWQHANSHADSDELAADLRALHAYLGLSGHEFGHRVMFESLRYAAVLAAMGIEGRWEVLDRIVLTKLLPKLHGTRTRIEKPLRSLLSYAQGEGEPTAAPRLPLSAAKLDRMLVVLAEAQFVSFTE